MTTAQKVILAVLSVIALLALGSAGCALIFFTAVTPTQSSVSDPQVVAQQPAPTPLPPDTATPPPPATPTETATPTPLPSATSTRVVSETPYHTPTPTRANCVNQVTNFGASGVINDDEVKQFLREVIPPGHLDGCRGIEYIHKSGAVHGTPIAGSIIPIYREIQVFAVDPQFQSADQILDTLTHEVGHNVHKNLRAENIELDTYWGQLFRQSEDAFARDGSGFVSDYARTDKFEDFAETYMAYVRYPAWLKSVNPAKYEFMRLEVFAGLEYSP